MLRPWLAYGWYCGLGGNVKFMRWVIEVCPLRLLVEFMAAYTWDLVSQRHLGVNNNCMHDWLTDSAAASSSASLGRLWFLFCFRKDWLFLAEGIEARAAEPAPRLPDPPPRRC